MRAFELEVDGEAETTAPDLVAEWSGVDLPWIVEAYDGTPVAYVTLGRRGGVFRADGYVHPAHCGRGLGGYLLALTEHAALRDRRSEVVLRNGISTRDDAARRLFGDRGYAPARHFWRMGIDMNAPPPPPAAPTGVAIGVVAEASWREFHAVNERAFADHWGNVPETFEHWLARQHAHADHDPGLWFAAREGRRIVGVAECCLQDGRGFVSALGVASESRGRGIGEALLRHALAEFWRRGEREVRLGVDAANQTGATRLYERVGMRVIAEYCVYEKAFAPARGDGRPHQ
jgi:mycothiol synthase